SSRDEISSSSLRHNRSPLLMPFAEQFICCQWFGRDCDLRHQFGTRRALVLGVAQDEPNQC
ncbi:MAG: hypothetical protein ABSF08_14960, partial [Candidatus Cybelea sp.]